MVNHMTTEHVATLYELITTPHLSEYDTDEHRTANAPQAVTYDSLAGLHEALDGEGVPRSVWSIGHYRFGGYTWLWHEIRLESESGWQVSISHRQTGRPVTDAAEAHEAMVSLAQPQDEPIEQAFPGTNSWLVTLTLPAEQMAELEDGDELEMRSELYVLEVEQP